MRHDIDPTLYGPTGDSMADAVSACVHCGFCLSACPTYAVLGEEMDSPRGRIILMKEVLEQKLDLNAATAYIDRCLGCLGCVTACPSGVEYGELLTSFRGWAADKRQRTPVQALSRTLVEQTLPYRGRFRLAALTGRIAKPLQSLLPAQLSAMLSLLPDSLPGAEPLPASYPAVGKRRARVALLIGCVQQVLSPEINWATLRVLAANGVEVVIPPHQGCCGSLSMHTGAMNQARTFARANLAAFDLTTVDAVITNAAGCGSGIKEYELLFAGEADLAAAETYAHKTRDLTEFLADLGPRDPKPLAEPLRVAYHDACHLAHAQGIRAAPRDLLARIPNVTVLDFPEVDLCCGSAGTYNVEQPAIAAQLGQRKAANILSVQPDAVAMGNIGCLIQIATHLRQSNAELPIYHTVQILDMAYA